MTHEQEINPAELERIRETHRAAVAEATNLPGGPPRNLTRALDDLAVLAIIVEHLDQQMGATARRLRLCAAGRREYADRAPGCRAILLAEADVLDSAARIAEGDLQPIRRMLPSWRWTQAQPSPGEASEPDKPQQESP